VHVGAQVYWFTNTAIRPEAALTFVLDSHSGVPVYRQIVDQVRFQVAAGVLAPGDEVPSTRVLSESLGINPMTVSKAWALLEAEGMLERRPGLPLVVSALPPEAKERERRAQLRERLGPVATAVRQLGVPDAEALALFREALAEARAAGPDARAPDPTPEPTPGPTSPLNPIPETEKVER
jgi:GntR family transcriptional regulator